MNAPVHDPFTLKGKTILVTGASSGLGRQTAITCAQRGARLIITGRDANRLEETYARLKKGADHVQMSADLTSQADRERLVTIASSVNGLVHCAGQQKHCPIRQLSEQAMTDMYAINFLAPVMLTQRLLQTGALEPNGSDRKSTRLNSSHLVISYAVFCLKKKKKNNKARSKHRQVKLEYQTII